MEIKTIGFTIKGGKMSELKVVDMPENSQVDKLFNKLENTNSKLTELTSLENKILNEDLIVQEREWMKNRMDEQRAIEDRQREEIFEKQKMLDEMRKDQAEFFAQSKQMKIYNQMHEEEQRDQIYAIHGVSVDKFQGMKEYKNALYQGTQIILLFVDIILCAGAAFLYGFSANVFVLFAALFAARISLLPREHKGSLNQNLYSFLSKVFSFLPTPLMILVLVVKETALMNIDTAILICTIAAVALSAFGALDYYVRNPYREDKKACREAKADIKSLEKDARKAVSKNIKYRHRLEAKLLKQKTRQEAALVHAKEKAAIKELRKENFEQKKAVVKEKFSELKATVVAFFKKNKNKDDENAA